MDRASLLEIMQALGVRPRKVKGVLALLAERASRFKLNGALVRRSPLSSVIELEGMRLGVEGKTDGWQALRRSQTTTPASTRPSSTICCNGPVNNPRRCRISGCRQRPTRSPDDRAGIGEDTAGDMAQANPRVPRSR